MQSCEFAVDLGGKSPHALDGLTTISISRNIAATATESVSLGLKWSSVHLIKMIGFFHFLTCSSDLIVGSEVQQVVMAS